MWIFPLIESMLGADMDMNKATTEFKVEKKSVNSKVLCDDVQHQIEELMIHGGVVWSSDTHRDSFVETIDDVLAKF